MLYDTWAENDQRIKAGTVLDLPVAAAKELIANGKAERADPLPGGRCMIIVTGRGRSIATTTRRAARSGTISTAKKTFLVVEQIDLSQAAGKAHAAQLGDAVVVNVDLHIELVVVDLLQRLNDLVLLVEGLTAPGEFFGLFLVAG